MMNFSKRFLAALISLFMLHACGSQNDTPEEFGKAVYESIRDNDYETFQTFFGTKDDYFGLLDKSSYPEKEKVEMREQADQNVKELLAKIKPAFEKIKERAAEAGINWNETSFKKVEYDLQTRKNIEGGDMMVEIEYKGLRFRIRLDDCMKANRGWIMTDDPRFIPN